MTKSLIIGIIVFILSTSAARADIYCPTPTPHLMTMPITPAQTVVAQGVAWFSDTRGTIAEHGNISATMPLTAAGWLTNVANIGLPFRWVRGFHTALNTNFSLLGGIFTVFLAAVAWRFAVIIFKFLVENAGEIMNFILDVWNAIPFKFS